MARRRGKSSSSTNKQDDSWLSLETSPVPSSGFNEYFLPGVLFAIFTICGSGLTWVYMEQQQTIESLSETLTSVQTRINQLQQQIGDPNAQLANVGGFEERLLALEEAYASAQRQVELALATSEQIRSKDLHSKVWSLQTEMNSRLAELQQNSISIAALNAVIKNKSIELEVLKQNVNAILAANSELTFRISGFTDTLSVTKSRLDEEISVVESLMSQLKGQKKDIREMKESITRNQKAFAINAQELMDFKELLELEQAKRTLALRNQLKTLHMSLKDSQTGVGSHLKAQLEEVQTKIVPEAQKPRRIEDKVQFEDNLTTVDDNKEACKQKTDHIEEKIAEQPTVKQNYEFTEVKEIIEKEILKDDKERTRAHEIVSEYVIKQPVKESVAKEMQKYNTEKHDAMEEDETTKKHGSSDEDEAAEKHEVTNKDETADTYGAIDEDETTEKHGATDEGEAVEKHGATDESESAEKHGATVEEETAYNHGATNESKSAEKHGATDEEETADNQGATDEDETAEKHGATEKESIKEHNPTENVITDKHEVTEENETPELHEALNKESSDEHEAIHDIEGTEKPKKNEEEDCTATLKETEKEITKKHKAKGKESIEKPRAKTNKEGTEKPREIEKDEQTQKDGAAKEEKSTEKDGEIEENITKEHDVEKETIKKQKSKSGKEGFKKHKAAEKDELGKELSVREKERNIDDMFQPNHSSSETDFAIGNTLENVAEKPNMVDVSENMQTLFEKKTTENIQTTFEDSGISYLETTKATKEQGDLSDDGHMSLAHLNIASTEIVDDDEKSLTPYTTNTLETDPVINEAIRNKGVIKEAITEKLERND